MRFVSLPESGERFDLGRPGGVAAWNRALNRRYGMGNLTGHTSRLVRWIEARRRREIARLASSRPFERAADLGAEDGSLSELWRGAGRFTLLLDVDPAPLARSGRAGVVADAGRLPFAAGSFDLVVLSALLEHLLDPAAAVAECARILRPGGRLVAYVPWDGAVVPLKRFARRIGFGLGPLHEGMAPGHLRRFDAPSLRALFSGWKARIRRRWLSLGYYVEAIR